MKDILDIITSRRNAKSFLPKLLSWEKIARVLDAGRHAPSSGNIQNWKFIVIIKPEQKQEIAEIAHNQYELTQAAALIVICGEIDKAERYYGLRGKRLYTAQNCAAAAQNMLLEAHSMGLGGSWIGAFDEDKLKGTLGMPDTVRPQAIIAIGYMKDVPEKQPKYPLETVVYFHGWRNKLQDPHKYLNNFAVIMARKADALKQKFKEKLQNRNT